MPLQKLQFRPGVNREGTTLANEGGWYDCDKVRFRSGYPEKIGGWSLLSSNTFLGVCRSLWNWITLKNYNLLGVGTNLKFYVEDNGSGYYDITPIRETNGNTASPGVNLAVITLTASGTTLTITDSAAESLQVNDFITLSGAGVIGGVNVNGEYQIASVLGGTSYTVTLATPTTGSNSAATIQIAYQINTGQAIYTEGTGWGSAPWGGFISGTASNALNGGINSSVTTITVNSTTGFTSTGAIWIEGEYITYSGITSTQFTGCVRGADGTTAAAHSTAALVYQSTAFPGWGEGFTVAFGFQLRLWSQCNFGEDLLFSPRGGALYLWQPGAGSTPAYSTRGVLVDPTTYPNTPSQINQIMVSDSTRIVIAFGCNNYVAPLGDGIFDPLLIRWTAQESYTEWTPTAENQAGSYRLSHGSEIVGAFQTRQEIVVLTDAAIYSMQYLGPPFVWGFTLLADNISIASPNVVATAAGVVYWMGTDKFYVYSGRVETLPCSVRQYIFEDINRDQEAQFFSGTNEGYSEVWWFYCSVSGPDGTGTIDNPNTTIDRYVIFNYLDRVWYYGTMDRTAWLDSPLRQFPQAATGSNQIVLHETSVDDETTDPATPINAYIQSSDFDIGDGHNYGFVWRLIPDITFDGSNTFGLASSSPSVTFTIRPRQNPGSGYGVSTNPQVTSTQSYAGQQAHNVQEFTEIIYTRVRGRQIAFKVESNTRGVQWQLGVPRIDVRPDGRR